LVQLSTPELEDILTRAYSDGTMITGMMEEDGIGREYTDDFVATIQEAIGSDRLDGVRVLEIGSGTGYLLHRLRLLGADVRGIEPGPHGETGGARYGVPIERGFFPGVDVGDGFDLVILYMLIEHVADPEALVREVIRLVRPGGTILAAVQDEETYIASGELSLLFHEHYSYFTASSLARTLRAAGGRRVDLRRSSFSNLLVAAFSDIGEVDDGADIRQDVQLATAFRGRAERLIETVWTRLDDIHHRGGTVGIFVPARAMNILAMRSDRPDGIRFFDDNQALHGTYYPGFATPVEDRAGLIARPPTALLVMSLSFGDAIVASIRPELPADVAVMSLREMLAR
jgi:SAM-dependent methyltransferase